jgi:hypothetical protein
MERAADGQVVYCKRRSMLNETMRGALENAATDEELQAEVRHVYV